MAYHSPPVRRPADKTQVFPLERHDSVRTRLTHSHEVSNLARSIGIGLVHRSDTVEGVTDAKRNIPSILAAVGLAHDLGNPPFGHQGAQLLTDMIAGMTDTFAIDLHTEFKSYQDRDFKKFADDISRKR